MSRLEELIAELCPDGVEFKALSQVLTIRNGRDYKGFAEGDIPVYGSGGIITYIDTYAYDRPSVLIPRKGSLDKLYYLDVPFWTVDTIFYTEILTGIVIPKYVYYCLQKQHLEKLNTAGGVPSLTQAVLSRVPIPVPPLPVQHEIVRILDNFTELTEELTAKLTAELTARKKQYEYYRDLLLTFDDERQRRNAVQWLTLGEVCNLKAGKAISANDISDTRSTAFSYPCFGGNGLRGYVIKCNQNGDFPLIGRQGALCGNVCYASGKFYATEHAVVVSQKGNFIPRFLYHLLISLDLNQYKTAGAQPGLSVGRLEKIKIPVPPLAEQARIVAILDRFDALCHDLTSGLPAEIEARRKQYEYYRDKLLTFKELSA
ncbi:MAG: restriction endonuclease subunit S [Oscillospiraceae bacterium]|nr:restriction endonuclease subunit S [Oscillospiraceae bacterium]